MYRIYIKVKKCIIRVEYISILTINYKIQIVFLKKYSIIDKKVGIMFIGHTRQQDGKTQSLSKHYICYSKL